MQKVYLCDLSKLQAKEYLIEHFLERYGRHQGRITLFSEDLAPSLFHAHDLRAPFLGEVVWKQQANHEMRMTLLQGKYAWFLEKFTLEEMLEMVEEARSRAWYRYHRLRLIVMKAKEENECLDVPFSDLYDWYGNEWVLFLFGYNAIGKTTWIAQQVTQLFQRTYVKTFDRDEKGIAFVIAPLVTEFVLVDSGRFLPSHGNVSREQVIETIGPSLEEYSWAIRRPVPIAVCDAGDNFGQRVAMAIRARDMHREMHMELITGPWEVTLPRNLSRARYEFSMNPEQINETFQWMCKLFSTTYNIRDTTPANYDKLFERIYGQQKCVHQTTFGVKCSEKAHDPRLLCERFCKHCHIHCPDKRKGVVYPANM
jgi:hypothetical protein